MGRDGREQEGPETKDIWWHMPSRADELVGEMATRMKNSDT